jgi:hypothetical protein
MDGVSGEGQPGQFVERYERFLSREVGFGCDIVGRRTRQASRLALLFTGKRRQSTGAKMALQSSIRTHFTTPRQKTAQSDYEELASPNYYA